MDYTLSNGYSTHTGTGQRMHREDQAIPTAIGDRDLNAVNWSLMEVIKEAGLAGVQFDPDAPASYRVLLNAIKAIYAATTSDLPGRVAIFWQPTPPPGWTWIEGDLLSRTAYPRLWTHVQTVGAVSDAEWLAGAFGRFSSGDGSTTFRMPDIRGYFFRAADRSRGVDISRLLFTAQAWLNGAHVHGVTDAGHLHTLLDLGHLHGVNDPAHSHGVNDPAHVHKWGANNQNGVAAGAGNAGQGPGTFNDTSASATGITVQANGTGISVAGASSNVSVNPASTGVTLQSSGGVESRPLNLAVPFYMKY